MGNNIMGGTNTKTTKIMKINGDVIKLKTPAKVSDVINDYPNHILLDSNDFLKFNIRADPLDPNTHLKPNKIYLLVELPVFPTSLRRVKSDVSETRRDIMRITTQRSISNLSIMTRSTASVDSDDVGSLDLDSPVGLTRVRMKMRKPVVEKIMAECKDDDEVAKRILRLYFEEEEEEERDNAGDDNVPVVVVDGDRRCFRVGCSPPCRSFNRKYEKLSF